MRRSPTAAAAMFRRSVELALRDLTADVEAWKIEKRIDKLAADGRVAQALRDWVHLIGVASSGA
ncbi:MAG: DUF4145 domain-containing protein [Janthinobacterium lividum]